MHFENLADDGKLILKWFLWGKIGRLLSCSSLSSTKNN